LFLKGEPYDWENLKENFGGSVEMDQVTFLTTNWENIDPPTGNSGEQMIRGALGYDINDGLVFERLMELNAREAWKVIDRVIEDASEWPKWKEQYRDRRVNLGEKRALMPKVRPVQRELDALREELNQTKAGQKVVKALRECYAEEKETLQPLRDEMRRDNITAAAKEAAEKELSEKYLIFRKRFQSCFLRAADLRIPIGQPIVDQYFDYLPDEEVST
jgi:hypothetical protein